MTFYSNDGIIDSVAFRYLKMRNGWYTPALWEEIRVSLDPCIAHSVNYIVALVEIKDIHIILRASKTTLHINPYFAAIASCQYVFQNL